MKLGVIRVPTGIDLADGRRAVELAQAVEAAGCESLWVVEHIVVPESYESRYPFHPSGKMGLTIDDELPDPLIWLSYVAAATTTLKLATGVLILPLRNPVVLAKELATLDRLSGGRFMLGVGLGWLEEEFAAVGVPFAARGRRMDDYIDVMRGLWASQPTGFEGEFAALAGMHSRPHPTAGSIPVVLGGASPAMVRRAVRRGDGLHLNRLPPDQVEKVRELVDSEAAEIGRDPAEIELTCTAPDSLADAQRLADAGVGRLILSTWKGDVDDVRRAIGDYQDRVVSRLVTRRT